MYKFTSVLVLVLATSFSAHAADTKDMQEMKDAKVVKIQEINKNPSKWMNRKITIQGQVVRTSPDTLVIDGDGIFNDRILVIDQSKTKSKETAAATPEKAMKMNSELRLTGTVRKLTLSEVRDRYYAHPDEEVVSEFTTSMPVIVTDFKNLTPTSEKDETARP